MAYIQELRGTRAALRVNATSDYAKYQDANLVQLFTPTSKIYLSATNHVTGWQDLSPNAYNLLETDENSTLELDETGAQVIRCSPATSLAFTYPAQYGEYTVVLLAKYQDVYTTSLVWRNMGYSKFIYVDSNVVKSHFGDYYGNYDGINPNQWILIIATVGSNFKLYATGQGNTLYAPPNRGDYSYTPLADSTIGNGNFQLKQFMVYNRSLSDAEILALRDKIAASTTLTL